LITSNNLAIAFALALRIGVVAIDGPGHQISHLITFDSSGVSSKESSSIVTATANFRFLGLSIDIILYK
jgi:hypothetical protein